jgi:hypothetical protein
VGSIIRRYSPFLNFLKVRDDLLLEEIHIDSTGRLTVLMVLYTKLRLRWPSHHLPRRLARPMAATAALVATGPSITTKTAIAVMAAATTTRTTQATEAVVALLARPPPPLVPTVRPTHHG